MTTENKERREFWVRDFTAYGGSHNMRKMSAEETITQALDELNDLQLARVVAEAANSYFQSYELERGPVTEQFEEEVKGFSVEQLAEIVRQYTLLQYRKKLEQMKVVI